MLFIGVGKIILLHKREAGPFSYQWFQSFTYSRCPLRVCRGVTSPPHRNRNGPSINRALFRCQVRQRPLVGLKRQTCPLGAGEIETHRKRDLPMRCFSGLISVVEFASKTGQNAGSVHVKRKHAPCLTSSLSAQMNWAVIFCQISKKRWITYTHRSVS